MQVERFRLKWVALFALLVCGLVLRLIGIDFGLPLQLHPDEWSQVDIARGMLAGDLNPHFFRYGSLMLYQLFTLNGALQMASGGAILSSATYYLAARILSAVYGTATIAVVWWLGRLLGQTFVGWVAALLMAVAPEAVRQAHYATVDTALVFWMTLALAFGVWAFEKPSRSFVPAAVAAGLAIGAKYTGAFVVAPLLLLMLLARRSHSPVSRAVALLLATSGIVLGVVVLVVNPAMLEALARRWTTDGDLNVEYQNLIFAFWLLLASGAILLIVAGIAGYFAPRVRLGLGKFLYRETIVFGLTVIAVFLLSSPFVALDFPTAARDIFYEVRHIQLGAAAHVAVSDPLYAELVPRAFFPEPFFYWNWFLAQNGWLVVGASLLGAGALARHRPAIFWAAGLYVALLLFTLLRAANKGERYALPLLPILYVWAAVGIFTVAEWLPKRWRAVGKFGLIVAVMLAPLMSTVEVVHQNFILPDTRVLAWRWLTENVSAESVVVREDRTPDLEHVNTAFRVFPTIGAFDSRTFQAWRAEKADYFVIGTLRDYYVANAARFPEIVQQYEMLQQQSHLVAQFIADGRTMNGPPVWIYRVP